MTIDEDKGVARLTNLLAWLTEMPNLQDAAYEIRRYEGVMAWARQRIGFEVGDRVTLAKPVDFIESYGWQGYEECLAPGAPATVTSVDFNTHTSDWSIGIRLDREWVVSKWASETKRYWKGAADTTPEGYVPPRKYDQEHSPKGTRGTFSFQPSHLSKLDADA